MVESLSSENEWRGDDGAGEARPDAHKDVRTTYVHKQDAWPGSRLGSTRPPIRGRRPWPTTALYCLPHSRALAWSF